MFDVWVWAVWPYVAFALAIGGGLYRYYRDRFTFSSFSSGLLERRQLFWGSVPWHYGIVLLLIGHLIGLAFPGAVGVFNGAPARLYSLEVVAFGLALFSLLGISVLLVRRLNSPRARAVTTPMDFVVLVVLLAQVVFGLYTAIFQRWGSWWYLSNAVPYLISLATFQPKIEYAATLPFVTQLHTANAFLLVAIFPFSRLVHIFTIPVTYLWRPYQTVVWNRRARHTEQNK